MGKASSSTRFSAGMKSSDSSEWETPQWLYDELDKQFHFSLDAAATHRPVNGACGPACNHKCPAYFTAEDSALMQGWAHRPPPGANSTYMNPPYGAVIGDFVAKAVDEYERGNVHPLVMLLPARMDTRWMQRYVFTADWLLFLKGRLKFEIGGVPIGSTTVRLMKNSAPFPSVIALWGNAWAYSLEGYEHLGRVVRLND